MGILQNALQDIPGNTTANTRLPFNATPPSTSMATTVHCTHKRQRGKAVQKIIGQLLANGMTMASPEEESRTNDLQRSQPSQGTNQSENDLKVSSDENKAVVFASEDISKAKGQALNDVLERIHSQISDEQQAKEVLKYLSDSESDCQSCEALQMQADGENQNTLQPINLINLIDPDMLEDFKKDIESLKNEASPHNESSLVSAIISGICDII